MTTVSDPRIDVRGEKSYMGIRTQTPMIGMFQVVEKLKKELGIWIGENRLEISGPSFLRYHVIDMEGIMDIEVGMPVKHVLAGDGNVLPGTLPAGRYASLVYVGHGLTGNKALIGWINDNHLKMDKWHDPHGDAFRCRCETYLTDPKIQPKKTKWEIEVAIKLLDEAR